MMKKATPTGSLKEKKTAEIKTKRLISPTSISKKRYKRLSFLSVKSEALPILR
jgi:hypothetical protein